MSTFDALLIGAFLGQCVTLGLLLFLRREETREQTARAVRGAFRRVAMLEQMRPRGRNRELSLFDEVRLGTVNALVFGQRIQFTVTP